MRYRYKYPLMNAYQIKEGDTSDDLPHWAGYIGTPRPGDWLVEVDDSHVETYTDKGFRANFEEVE